jgi:hypothetical protein
MVTNFRRLLAVLVVLLSQATCLFAQEEVTSQSQAPAVQLTITAFSLMLIMLILCMPSRKRQSEKKT